MTEDCTNCGKEVDGHQLELCIECAAGLCTKCFERLEGYCNECVKYLGDSGDFGFNEDE